MQHRSNEDLSGCVRGHHAEGEHVCEMFVFQKPGQTKGLWGWNDTSALYCKECGRLATDHILLEEPKDEFVHKNSLPKALQKDKNQMSMEQIQALRQRQHEAELAAKTDLAMLDPSSDPLAINATRHAKSEIAPPVSVNANVASAMQLEKEKMHSDAFKEEVERMIQESVARDRQQAAEASGAALEPQTPKFSTSAELLEAVGLSQYASDFEREAMDPETLFEVMKYQGRLALEEVLTELGVQSKGHRMKIANLVSS